jgi:predicted HicB family RNase H-like nuclease
MNLLRYKDYQGAVEFDEGRLILRLLHIDDLITTEIDRASDARAAFMELVDDYLASCVELGKQPSKPFKGSFNVRVSPNLHKRAAFAAMEEGETLNAFVLSAIEDKIDGDYRGVMSPPAPRVNGTGFLQLSLVTCPIALVSATSKSENNLSPEATHSKLIVEIYQFVPRNQIDHLYLASPYYVIPDGSSGQDAYAVIRESIRSVDKVAIAHVTSADGEVKVIALEARDNGLLGTLLRYASHLDETWRRFVVCKELCHALEDDDGCHSVTAASMDNLVNAFSLRSKKNLTQADQTPPITAEFLAEAAAIELLCPMPIRRSVEARGLEDHEEVCAIYGIPYEYGWFAFGKQWMDAMEGFMKPGLGRFGS